MTAELTFEVVGARAEPHAAAPAIALRLCITAADDEPVHAIALNCQLRIEPQRRSYSPAEEAGLYDLFGETSQWGRSLRPFLWTNVAAMVTGFTGHTETDLLVMCSYDMEVAGARYLHGLHGGDVPLLLLFSGTAFGTGAAPGGGGFAAQPLSWSSEASFRLPQRVWREAMDLHFPNSGWLRLSHESLDGLARFKATKGLATWDQTVEQLLKEVDEP